ncbi:MAG: LysE family translocator [Candidatus Kryptoniota bacterium]
MFIIVAYVMGFITAIPVGATQIEIAKRSLHGQLMPAFMVVLGSVSSDVMYGVIAFFGLAPFMKSKTVEAGFELGGALILLVLAYLTFKQSKTNYILDEPDAILKSKHISLITGFSLAVTNPMMIFWWLLEAQIVKEIGLVVDFNTTIAAIFLLAAGFGLASYLCALAATLHWAKKFLSVNLMKKLNHMLGIFLILLAFYFLYASSKVLFNTFSR